MAVYKAGEAAGTRALERSVVAFGVFDGFHAGHRFLVERALEDARSRKARSCALTFDEDPDELFRPDSLKKLMSNEARIAALAASGIDDVVVLPFGDRFASMSPEEFLARTFPASLPAAIHLGCDARFGRGASGDVAVLSAWAARRSAETGERCRVAPHELLERDGAPVSASRIRALLADGAIDEANRLLGYAYRFAGTVVEGRRAGREMGFRTANLAVPAMLLAVGEGVYAAYAHVGGQRYKAAASVGVAPTFAEATAPCEAHLLDFEDDLYGREIELEFRARLRPMMRFDSVDELVATVMGDIAWVRDNL